MSNPPSEMPCPDCGKPGAYSRPATLKTSRARKRDFVFIVTGVLMMLVGAPLYLFSEGSKQSPPLASETQSQEEIAMQKVPLQRGIDSGRANRADFGPADTYQNWLAFSVMGLGGLVMAYGTLRSFGHRTALYCPNCDKEPEK